MVKLMGRCMRKAHVQADREGSSLPHGAHRNEYSNQGSLQSTQPTLPSSLTAYRAGTCDPINIAKLTVLASLAPGGSRHAAQPLRSSQSLSPCIYSSLCGPSTTRTMSIWSGLPQRVPRVTSDSLGTRSHNVLAWLTNNVLAPTMGISFNTVRPYGCCPPPPPSIHSLTFSTLERISRFLKSRHSIHYAPRVALSKCPLAIGGKFPVAIRRQLVWLHDPS